METKLLLDRLVRSEYGVFESAPLEYTADRERGIRRLKEFGVSGEEAADTWRKFERKYLRAGNGGVTFSSHGIDRAKSLGEEPPLDEGIRTSIIKELRDSGGSADLDQLHDSVGGSRKEFEMNLWLLRSRGTVETSTDLYGDRRSATLVETK